MTEEIFKLLDDGYEVKVVFLDITKVWLWRQGLFYKLKQIGIADNLLKILTNYFINRKQRVVLNSQYLIWFNVEAGVPQSSILVPLLFLTYINDLSDNLWTNPKLFTDDTLFFSLVKNHTQSGIDLNTT